MAFGLQKFLNTANKVKKKVDTRLANQYTNKVTELKDTRLEYYGLLNGKFKDADGREIYDDEGQVAHPELKPLADKMERLTSEIKNDPYRAYTVHEFQDISPPLEQPHKGAHEFRGGPGYLLRPGQKQIMSDEDFAKALELGRLDKETVEKYGGSMMDDYVMPDGKRYSQDYLSLQGMKGAEFVQERYPSEGLIKMMEGSKVKTERPLYIYRNTGYRSVQDPDLKVDPLNVKEDQVYSGMVINPNDTLGKEYIESLIQRERYGGFHQDPKIIRIEPGTEIYHPSGIADTHEVVVPGKAIKEGQSWDAKDFLKLEPSDVKEGTDLFSSLGLINNIA